jgi:hypothetical protein
MVYIIPFVIEHYPHRAFVGAGRQRPAGALMPRARITVLVHEVARETGFLEAFINLRTNELHNNEKSLIAAILTDGSNPGLTRMAQASQGVTPDQLVWTKSTYIRPESHQAGLARIIGTHPA